MEGEGERKGEVKVLNCWFSMYGMRVVIALNQKNVEYEVIEELDLEKKSDLLLQSNPVHKKIPILLHNGKSICESHLILQYIDDTWPSPPLINPSTPYNNALHRFWAHYIDNKLYDAGARLIRSLTIESQNEAMKDLVESYKMMEKALVEMSCGVKPFFGGDLMGLVDVMLAPILCWILAFETIGDFKFPGEDECPLLSAWVKRVLEIPNVKKTLPDSHRIIDFSNMYRKRWLDST